MILLAAVLLAASAGAQVSQAPVVSEVKLGEPNSYWRTELAFDDGSAKVRVSAAEDADKGKDKYYLAFAVDGQLQPVWGSVGFRGANLRDVAGVDYKVGIGNKMAYITGHVERVVLTVKRETDGRVVKQFTAGELEKAIWDQCAPFSQPMLDREFRACVMQDVTAGPDGKVQPIPGKFSVYVGAYRTEVYGGDKTTYVFDHEFGFSLDELQRGVAPRAMKRTRVIGRDKVQIVYGFHVEDGVLLVTDLTEPPHHAFLPPPPEKLIPGLEPGTVFQGL